MCFINSCNSVLQCMFIVLIVVYVLLYVLSFSYVLANWIIKHWFIDWLADWLHEFCHDVFFLVPAATKQMKWDVFVTQKYSLSFCGFSVRPLWISFVRGQDDADVTEQIYNNCFEWLSLVSQFASPGSETRPFLRTKISRGSVATCLRTGEIFNLLLMYY